MYAPTILIEKATSLISGLRPLYEFKNDPINELQVKILQLFAAYPDFTAYDICRKTILGKENDHGWIRKQVSDLAQIGLIER
ncbi:MAG: hypothetical protein ACRD8Z_24765, partial [Nitrososphaeraceae archaeon]